MENTTIADKPLTKKQTERAEAIESLKESLKPGDTVYTILRSVSASGMSRCLDVISISNNQPFRLTWDAAIALEQTYDRRRDAIRVSGCGLDVGYAVASRLAEKLFGDYRALNHRWL